MKYTIDEDKKTITIHSLRTKLTVDYFMMVFRDWSDFEIIFELDKPTHSPSTMITDSGYEDIKYVYNKLCECVNGNGAMCNCELKNKK